MSGVTIYQTALRPEWIDDSGHLHSGYLVLVFSLASDALMDRLGLGAPYRARTDCTLYTLEMHLHCLQQVNAAETLDVDVHLLASDSKRLHIGFDARATDRSDVVATGEFVYLHMRQGESPRAVPFPPDVEQAIADVKRTAAADPWAGPGSRPMAVGK